VVTTGLSYWLFARGIRHIGAAAAVTITLLEPAAAAVIAAVALHEELSAGQWVGIVLIGTAITITGRTAKASKPTGADHQRQPAGVADTDHHQAAEAVTANHRQPA
jgi:DME family drug/metabolite transporter